jgi:dienelactone hydrolase
MALLTMKPNSMSSVRAIGVACLVAMLASSRDAASQDKIIFDGIKVQEGALPVDIDGHTLNLEVRIFYPKGDGPFPLVVINHGSPDTSSQARMMKPGFTRPALWFARNGFIVVIPMRPGFGRSDGPDMEASEDCENRDYVKEARITAAAESAIVISASRLAEVNRHRIIVVGHSAGGFGAIAVADAPPPGVVGIINVAGGRGGDDNESICGGQLRLIEATRTLGKGNQLPQLWLYAENDHFFPPTLGHRLFDVYKEGSVKPMNFVKLPSFGTNGHNAFEFADTSVWAAPVTSFVGTTIVR